MEKWTHPIRFRLGTVLLWDTAAASLSRLKYMKYNLILNKFLILFLEKYKSWYCIHYYSIFSKQSFLFFFFFYLKNYINKRLKLFRIGSIFRNFRSNKRWVQRRFSVVSDHERIKKKICQNFLFFFKVNTLKTLNFVLWCFLLKSFLSYFFGVLKKKNFLQRYPLKNFKRANFIGKQRPHFFIRRVLVYLNWFYFFIQKQLYFKNLLVLVFYLNFFKFNAEKNSSIAINLSLVPPVIKKYTIQNARVVSPKLLKKRLVFHAPKLHFFRKNVIFPLRKKRVFLFKTTFFVMLLKYIFWCVCYKRTAYGSITKPVSVGLKSSSSHKKVFLHGGTGLFAFYKNFIVFKKSSMKKKVTKSQLQPAVIISSLKKYLFHANYKRWLAIKLLQLQLSLTLGLLLSKVVSIHLINTFRILPQILQPKTFRVLNTLICQRYFIKNLRDKTFILNFLNLFFMCSYFKFINALVRFIAAELVIRRRMKQLKFLNLLKKILISEFFDKLLLKLRVLGFYVLITGKIGRKPRTQTMSILKNFRSVQTTQVKISYSCKKAITFFGVLSIKFWLYYV